jgi:hypothetical protein
MWLKLSKDFFSAVAVNPGKTQPIQAAAVPKKPVNRFGFVTERRIKSTETEE